MGPAKVDLQHVHCLLIVLGAMQCRHWWLPGTHTCDEGTIFVLYTDNLGTVETTSALSTIEWAGLQLLGDCTVWSQVPQ